MGGNNCQKFVYLAFILILLVFVSFFMTFLNICHYVVFIYILIKFYLEFFLFLMFFLILCCMILFLSMQILASFFCFNVKASQLISPRCVESLYFNMTSKSTLTSRSALLSTIFRKCSKYLLRFSGLWYTLHVLKKIVLHQEYALNIVLITLLIYVMKFKEISQVKVFWIIKIVSFSDEKLTSDSLN